MDIKNDILTAKLFNLLVAMSIHTKNAEKITSAHDRASRDVPCSMARTLGGDWPGIGCKEG